MGYEANHLKIESYKRQFERYNAIRRFVCKNYFKLYHRLEIIGLENIPSGAALIATNHGGGLDLDVMALTECCHPSRVIHPLIAEQWHFLNHWWGKYFIGGGIPLWTRGGIRWEYIDPYLNKNGKRNRAAQTRRTFTKARQGHHRTVSRSQNFVMGVSV